MREDELLSRVDQETDDFRLEKLDDDAERAEAEEAANRKEEYQRICLYLMDYMTLKELSGCAALLMHEWTDEEGAYYRDGDGNTFLFYLNFEISKRDQQWMFENQDDSLLIFWDADLLSGLKAIDMIIEQGIK